MVLLIKLYNVQCTVLVSNTKAPKSRKLKISSDVPTYNNVHGRPLLVAVLKFNLSPTINGVGIKINRRFALFKHSYSIKKTCSKNRLGLD